MPTSVVVGGTVADEVNAGAPSNGYACPSEDGAGFPVGEQSDSGGALFCSYPAVTGENPYDFYCEYNASTGALTQDSDAGYCPATAPYTSGGGATVTGTVTFTLYNNNSASGTPLYTDSNVALVSGAATSGSYTTTATGADYWVVNYSGDSNYGPAFSGAAAARVIVETASPSVSSIAGSGLLAVGQSTTDTATVSGGYNPTGTVTFKVYSDDNCSGPLTLLDSDVPLSGETATVSYTATAPGALYWVATYNGDDNNNGANGSCSADPLNVNATALTQTISFGQRLGPYVIGNAPVAQKATASSTLPVTYTVTGPCSVIGSTLKLTSTGVCKVTASQAGGSGYSAAASVTRNVVVGYGFKGLSAPKAKAEPKPGSKLAVQFVLTNASGRAITGSAAAALAKAHDVRVTLSGPRIKTQTAVCKWSKGAFDCSLKVPKSVKTGKSRSYHLSAEENLGSGFIVAPVLKSAKNPTTIHFK
jgi:hypothetical protein